MDTLEAIKHRYSCRAFKPEQISREQTEMLIEATALGRASVYIMAVTVLQQKKELMNKLKIEAEYIPVVMVAVGYAKDEVECKRENKITCKCI